ncbi:MAG: hypothetical protein WAU84_26160 [Thermoguttaceae bacterium]
MTIVQGAALAFYRAQDGALQSKAVEFVAVPYYANCNRGPAEMLVWLAEHWRPVTGVSSYGTSMDKYNRVTFDGVETTGLRIEVQLQADWCGGILEWRVE